LNIINITECFFFNPEDNILKDCRIRVKVGATSHSYVNRTIN